MESQVQPKSIRWAPQLPKATVDDWRSGANAAGPAIVSSSSRVQTDTHGTQTPLGYNSTVRSPSLGQYHPDLPIEETEYSGQGRAGGSGQAATPSKATPSAPSTDTASNTHTTASSTSPTKSSFDDDDLGGESCTIETRPTSELTSNIELMEICQGTFVAVTQEPGHEDKLQWRTLSRRIHLAIAKTCRRYPNLSVQLKLAGSSAGCLQPVILFVCPPDTQKQVRKFVKKQKWLSESECGYRNLIVDGHFARVALDGESGLDGGLFIHTDTVDVQTLCAKLGRLEGALNPTGAGSRFTIGGVVVVNDTLCCLTTGHVLFDGPDASEVADFSDDEETDQETDDEDLQKFVTATEHPTLRSQPTSNTQDQNSDEDGEARREVSKETRIGRLLTTSNWKRGVLASNEDWSLIRLDAACCADEWIVNQFLYPGTGTQDPLQITIDKLARTEAEMMEAEVIVLAGCTGLQKGQLNTTAVQLYLDNAIFEAREIVTHKPLSMGDSGSWVVHGSKLLGHVFAVQEGTSYSYMIPITQVLEDIQRSLLAYSIELPTQTNQVKVSLLCPKDGRSHASLVAFGVNACPNCDQDLISVENAQVKDLAPEITIGEDRESLGNDEDSNSSPSDGHESSDHSDPSIKASTVPTSYFATYGNHGLDHKDSKYVPLEGETIPWTEYCRDQLLGIYSGPNYPYIALQAALDEVQPGRLNIDLIGRIKTDPSVVFDLSNPINDNVRATRITIMTPWLNDALRHVVRWDPAINQRRTKIVIGEPYAVLVRHFHELTAYASELRGVHIAEKSKFQGPETGKQSTSSQPQNHPQHEEIDALIDFTQRVIDAADVATELSRHERNACTYSKLWLLLYSGMTVYANANDSGGLAAYVVVSFDVDTCILRQSWQSQPYIVHMWRLHYDGQYITQQRSSVAINYFDGERDITSLKVFPCEHLDKVDGGKTRRELEDRGRRWYQLLRGGVAYYDGELPADPDLHYEGPLFVDRGGIRDGSLEGDSAKLLPFEDEPYFVHERGKVAKSMEDVEESFAGFPWTDYGPLDPGKIEDLELRHDQAGTKGHKYILCAPYLPGFLVDQKEWAWVDVNYCSPLKIHPHALDHLLLPGSTKDIIRTLVQNSRHPTTPSLHDSERRKRSGNHVILLHGSSGTGKRYTAECLAEAEGRILMTIHNGALGRDVYKARYLLRLWFRLAQTFNAIVLVPTADSFVEQPCMGVGARGDIISVFWECLEAYSGVVILTISRSVKFDEVALSRITFSIHCADFDSETRRQIGWQEMRRLQEERGYFAIGLEVRVLWESTLREVDWNGHEIRSVLENALAIARNRDRIGRKKPLPQLQVSDEDPDSPFLTGDDLRTVIESKKTFDKYVKEG